MRNLTVIVPNYNMGSYLRALFESIIHSDLASVTEEIIFVTEKSTDGSEDIVRDLIAEQDNNLPKVRLIQPEKREGAFMTRYHGATHAKTEKLIFLDARTRLTAKTAKFIAEELQNYSAICSVQDIDIKKNIYCLYWQRSHEVLFRRSHEAYKIGPVHVDDSNYKDYIVGTTGLICSRDVFVKCCEPHLKQPLFSDDMLLLSELVKLEPITIHPGFRINWEPRDNLKGFLQRLFDRGPSFAEYHVFEHQGPLFYAVIAGALFVLLILSELFSHPLIAIGLIACGVLAAMLSTLFFTRNLREFLKLAPLQAAVIAAYGFGALRGIYIVWNRKRQFQNVKHD